MKTKKSCILPLFVLAASAAVAQAQTITLIEGYNTWSTTPGTDGVTSAELFFQQGTCGVFLTSLTLL